MEKRALLALVLSLLVLVFWEYFFGLFHVIEPPQQETVTTTTPPSAESPSTAQPPKAPGLPPDIASPQALPKDRLTDLGQHFQSWLVEASDYRMQILSPGARINSFRLNKFRQEVDPESPPMEMVPTQASGYLPMAVDLLHHPDWQLSTRSFESRSPAQLTLPSTDSPQNFSLSTEVPERLRVTKSFTLTPSAYFMDVEIRLENLASESLSDQMGISFFFQPYAGPKEESSNNPSHLAVFAKGTLETFSVKDLQKKETIFKTPMDWVGYEDNYFIQAVAPLEKEGYQVIPRILDADKGLLQVVCLTDPFQLEAGKDKTFKMRLYLGPKNLNELDRADHNLSHSVDYGWFTVLAKPLLHLLIWCYKYTHNYGVAIILITVLIKLVFWPLTHKSYQSMKMMKKIQPKIAQIREKHKDDREKLNTELMGVYRTYKVNPMGGCLPMVLQIPVFFALYRMLNGAVELRHEPFIWWINNLTAPDRLNIGIPIPYLGGIPVLTILMGISMFLQQKMTPSAGDPRQDQMMMLMPVVFTFFFINFPSGLVLYWLVNNVLSIAQQYWINRRP